MFPIKLFYTSNMPIILVTALISNMYFFSKVLAKKYRGNIIIDFVGVWQDIDSGLNSIPVSGLAYYLSPPRGFNEL
jgi:protein transport protein SEC61 subunit alpha